MLTTSGDSAKKQKILELLRTQPDLLYPSNKLSFHLSDIFCFTVADPSFFLEVLRDFAGRMFYDSSFMDQLFQHATNLLVKPEYASSRELVMRALRHHIDALSS
mmetsp:Transcript_6281/g.10665  ORF Transcript_6281/g.10665 Transcript_6281/m.10665 type:complete len:104 (-) Transcript_6281:1394-1705(-)